MPPAPKWPLYSDYREAVQNPKVCFKDTELKRGTAQRDRLGLPRVSSGNFGCVFRLNLPGSAAKGVKCFTTFLGDRERRYRAVTDFLKKHPLAAMMSFEYRPGDIMLRGKSYPLLVMEWIEGRTLDTYTDFILRNSVDRRELLDIADAFRSVVKGLEDVGAAHGDLQHGNIIVTGDRLRLVDLDGMFVPAVAGLGSTEIGLPDYQHPKRDGKIFGPALDGFAALVIYLSLIALHDKPELWDKFHDENLIFKRKDFLDPARSDVFRLLKGMKGEVARLAEALERACAAPPLAVPPLSSLVAPRPFRATPPSSAAVRLPVALRVAVTDATGRDLQDLICRSTRSITGGRTGRCSFTAHNLGSSSAQFTVSAREVSLRTPGPLVFPLEPGEKREVTLEILYRRKLALIGVADITISAHSSSAGPQIEKALRLVLVDQDPWWVRLRHRVLASPGRAGALILLVLIVVAPAVDAVYRSLEQQDTRHHWAEPPTQFPEAESPAVVPLQNSLDPAAIESALALDGDTIKTVQQILTGLSYDTHGIDGKLGPKTRQAIKDYQQREGLQPTGYLDTDVILRIFRDG